MPLLYVPLRGAGMAIGGGTESISCAIAVQGRQVTPAAHRLASADCLAAHPTIAAALARTLDFPHIAIDTLFWQHGWAPIPDAVFHVGLGPALAACPRGRVTLPAMTDASLDSLNEERIIQMHSADHASDELRRCEGGITGAWNGFS
ncbi:hypothetical protein BC834DRAFT_972449 [Gloeopeniophorella convolvens]|nr:hypothetical protein BC834DRAFT_972449 [Gloeopeniophorella convolvens]